MNDVIGSHLNRYVSDGDVFNNYRLRLGEVQNILPPSHKRNLSKKYYEYDVYVQHRANGTAVTKIYNNCYLVNMFGGLADKMHFTLRADGSATKGSGRRLGKGSKVLILCIGGESLNAVIVGGIRDEQDVADDEKAGHHLHFVFNGIDCYINDGGELALTYKGKTQIDGTLDGNVDKAVTGTQLQLLKDGSFQVTSPGSEQTLIVDHANHKMELRTKAGQVVRIDHANKRIEIVADSAMNVTVNNGKMNIQSQGVVVGAGTDAWMLGTTYRNAEARMNNALASDMAALQAALQAASTALTTAGASMVVPVTGAVVAAPQVTLAAQALLLAAQLAQQMGQAIATFEGGASTYLSKKNTTD